MNLLAFSLLACRPEESADHSGTQPVVTSDFCAALAVREDGATTFYEDNPTYPDVSEVSWETTAPDGVDLAALEAVADSLSERPFLWSFLVVKGDALIVERYYNGATADSSNNVHSASKSVLSTLVGIALERGDLLGMGAELSALLPAYAEQMSSEVGAITLADLLTMTAGFEWTEDETEYTLDDSADWVGAILALPLEDAPGASFNYSSAQSHLLSAVLTEATRQSTCDYAHEQLFSPLGIVAEHWGRDPQGVFSGGYNLYLTPRELARFAHLYLDAGGGVVSAAWAEEAITDHVGAGWGYRYGYQWWLPTDFPAAIAWGYGGQLAYVLPEHDAVVVFTTNTRDYAVDFDAAELVAAEILPAL